MNALMIEAPDRASQTYAIGATNFREMHELSLTLNKNYVVYNVSVLSYRGIIHL